MWLTSGAKECAHTTINKDIYANVGSFFSGFPEAAYKNRPSSVEKVSMLAKSMPMNVPDHRKFGMDHSPPELDEDTQDIPTKINELARSLYVDAIGELPSPRLVEWWQENCEK